MERSRTGDKDDLQDKFEYKGGSRWYFRGLRSYVGPLFSSFRTTKFFTMLFFFTRVWGVFFGMFKESLLWKTHLCIYQKWSKSLGYCAIVNTCAFTHETPKNTTLHHPSTHSDNDTDQKHKKKLHFRTHLDQSRTCLYLLSRISGCALSNLCWSTRGMGRGSSWSSLDLETLESVVRQVGGVPSPRTVGGQAAVFLNVLRQSSEETRRHVLCRWKPTAFDASALGRDPRIHRGRAWANFSENRVKSLHIVSDQFTKSHPFVALASVGDPHSAPSAGPVHIRDRRKFAEEVLARLALGSGRRIARKISSSRRPNLDVICFSDEKIFRVDATAPGRSFHTFYRGKVVRRNIRDLLLFGIHHAKKEVVALLRRPIFEPLFMTHPSEVGSTTPWDSARRDVTRFVAKRLHFAGGSSAIQGALALQSCPLSAHSNRCVISFHGWLSRQTALDTSSSHPCHRTSRPGHTPRLKYHVHASPQHVATYQVDLPVLKFSSWKVTFPQFPSLNRSFCARRINATSPFFVTQNDATTRPPCTLIIGLMMYGRARWQEAEAISILYWPVRTRKSLPSSSSRSFRTQSHWSFTAGQYMDSE